MQLRLARAQEQGKRNVNFVLTATALLTPEETELVNRYRLADEICAQGTITVGLISKRQEPILVRVRDLVNGWTQRFDDLGSMLNFEERIRQSCQQVMIYLDAARKFGGQEVIDIHLPEDGPSKRPSLEG